jgi:hypothetical protein
MSKDERSPLERQVADVLRRARRLPVGGDRNDLRQLAIGLLWLHRKGKAIPPELSPGMYGMGERFDGATPEFTHKKSLAG